MGLFSKTSITWSAQVWKYKGKLTLIFQEPCETSRALEAFLGFHTKATGYIGPANAGYCDAASMLSKGWNKVKDAHGQSCWSIVMSCQLPASLFCNNSHLQALFPWGCVGNELDDVRSHPTFAHSMPRPTWVLLSVFRYFRWAHIAIISSSEDIWVETATKVWVLFLILPHTDRSSTCTTS